MRVNGRRALFRSPAPETNPAIVVLSSIRRALGRASYGPNTEIREMLDAESALTRDVPARVRAAIAFSVEIDNSRQRALTNVRQENESMCMCM